MKFPAKFAILPLVFALLACRPVLTIGWKEIFVLAIILLIFLAPTLFRFYKRYKEFKKYEKKK